VWIRLGNADRLAVDPYPEILKRAQRTEATKIMIPNKQTFTVSITIDDAAAGLEYYEKPFHAEMVMKFETQDGIIAHADLMIGNAAVTYPANIYFG